MPFWKCVVNTTSQRFKRTIDAKSCFNGNNKTIHRIATFTPTFSSMHQWFPRRILFAAPIHLFSKNNSLNFIQILPFFYISCLCYWYQQNILDLIESNNEADNCADALRCCLRMTQNLERRVIVRRLSSASQFAQKASSQNTWENFKKNP